jgi:hypothetical protein
MENDIEDLKKENEYLKEQLIDLSHQLFEERAYYMEQVMNGLDLKPAQEDDSQAEYIVSHRNFPDGLSSYDKLGAHDIVKGHWDSEQQAIEWVTEYITTWYFKCDPDDLSVRKV